MQSETTTAIKQDGRLPEQSACCSMLDTQTAPTSSCVCFFDSICWRVTLTKKIILPRDISMKIFVITVREGGEAA